MLARVLAVVVSLSVCVRVCVSVCHTPILYWNNCTNRAVFFLHSDFRRLTLHCVLRKLWYLQNQGYISVKLWTWEFGLGTLTLGKCDINIDSVRSGVDNTWRVWQTWHVRSTIGDRSLTVNCHQVTQRPALYTARLSIERQAPLRGSLRIAKAVDPHSGACRSIDNLAVYRAGRWVTRWQLTVSDLSPIVDRTCHVCHTRQVLSTPDRPLSMFISHLPTASASADILVCIDPTSTE